MEAESQGRYGWVVVAAGALMSCVAVGAMFSLAVFLEAITRSTGWSRASVSAAMTVNFLAMGVGGFLWGTLADRFGPRRVVLAGSLLLGSGLVLAGLARTTLQFQLAFGLVVGLALGSFFAPMIAAVSSWFESRRALAISLVSAGMGVAPMTVSPFAAWLLSRTDWRTAEIVIGVLVWALLVPAAFLVRTAPAATTSPSQGPASPPTLRPLLAAMRSPQFIVLSATFFACCAAHSGPIFHTVSYAIGCGLPTMAAVTIYSVEGVGGLAGRVVFGVMADRFGAKRILVLGLLVQALGAGAYVLARDLPAFYTVAAIFAFAYGGTMPLYASIAREYFGQHILGGIFGAAAMISSLGMALGPWIGGWIFDTFHRYDLLYVGSLVVGFGAVAIALAFPRRAYRPLAAAA